MCHRLILIPVFIGLLTACYCRQAKAQVVNTSQDSLNYKAIEKFSNKSKITKLIHPLIFKTVVSKPARQSRRRKIPIPNPFLNSEGKIVRNIIIVTLDPIGYSIRDTARRPTGVLLKTANDLHLKTHPWIIRNLLLFRKNEPFDSLQVRESERLIRSQRYVRDVMLYSLPSSPGSDSVDVYIKEWDVWSIIPSGSLTTSGGDVELSDYNFAGLGHRLQAEKLWSSNSSNNLMRFSYQIPNIRNSYISANFQYSFSDSIDLVKSIELNRTFYSPLTRWAGGIYLGQKITNLNYVQTDSIRVLSSQSNIQDFWVARSWQLFKGNSVDARTTNFILAGRMLRSRYPGRPDESEVANVFNKENIYFAGIGITSRKFIQDRNILNFRKIEDVPVGRAFGVTLGMDVQQAHRLYLGLQAAWGNYYPFGYLSTHLEYGTYIGSSGFQQEVITGSINYFTHLYTFGNWNIRQFVKPTIIIGVNRLPTDNVTFIEGMKGFEELTYTATNMMVLTLQTQSYAPWNLFGFHFGPFLFASLGILGNGASGSASSRLYSMMGVGVLIINDYLMFNTFQVSMVFYPMIPGSGNNIFRANAYRTRDYGFRDFEIAKPGVVVYR